VVAKLEAHAYDLTVKNIRVVDVTEQYVDIQARLKTKYELEQRFLSLIKKAKNVEEVLSVEAQLSQVRYEIESMEGKMRSLNDRIAFSTLNVSFYQVIQLEQVKPPTYLSKLAVAFRSGWDNLLSIFVGLVFLWPFIIFFTIGVFLTMKWKRRHRAETPQTT
jgi:ABC-type multidrug transport system permease subunit